MASSVLLLILLINVLTPRYRFTVWNVGLKRYRSPCFREDAIRRLGVRCNNDALDWVLEDLGDPLSKCLATRGVRLSIAYAMLSDTLHSDMPAYSWLGDYSSRRGARGSGL